MNSDEEVLHGLAQGADDFVAKPFDLQNLQLRVDALLRSSSSGAGKDELTSLPGADATKREMQRLTSLRETFAVAHCELMFLREFGRLYGTEARNRAIRHLARALEQCAEELTKGKSYVGHMGGGHFIVMMSFKYLNAYCPWVRKVWDVHVDRVYEKATGAVKPKERDRERRLDVLFCVTQYAAKEAVTPQQLFETLSHLRQMALGTNEGGVYVDRRIGTST
jgi:GGDEF domain-containing protein